MKTYVGLDVSLKEIAICVISQEGKVVARGSTVCDPQAITSWLDARALIPILEGRDSRGLSSLALA